MSTEKDNECHKSMVISYVNEEAEQYARRLKKELEHLKLSVFLDKDEIKVGDDWMDVIQKAILDCELFIALITPKYGYTQWTNKEIKLADIMQKPIIPISFLDNWPPECLAIQLASTHYIPWKRSTATKLVGGYEGMATDSQLWDVWDDPSIHSVVTEINDKFSGKIKATKSRKHGLLDGLPLFWPFSSKSSLGPNEKPLIVISGHSEQKVFIQFISKELSNSNINVWSTIFKDKTCNTLSEESKRMLYFKDQADKASLVLIVLSNNYCEDTTCKQQAFYCDYRKSVLPIKFNEFERPEWLSLLFTRDTEETIENIPQDINAFIDVLNGRVSQLISKKRNSVPSVPESTKLQSE